MTPSVRGSPAVTTGYLAHQTNVQHGCITHIAEQRAASDQVLPPEGLTLQFALHFARAVGTSAVPASRPRWPDSTGHAAPLTTDTASAVTGYAAPSARARSLPHAPNGDIAFDAFRISSLRRRPSYQRAAQKWRPAQERSRETRFLGGLPAGCVTSLLGLKRDTPQGISTTEEKWGRPGDADRPLMP